MAPTREIAASDDEGSDFDHIDNDDDDDVIQDATVQHNGAQEGHQSLHDGSNVSTDLSFFQRVYDEQKAVASAGTYISTNVTTQGHHQPASKSDQSSSITDPVPASRRPLKRKIGDNIVDLTEFTQVTTPRKSGDGKEKTNEGVAPSGTLQESGSTQQAVRTYGKRKQAERTQPSPEQKEEILQQSIVRIDPYEFPDDGDDDYTIPSIPKKKTKATAKRASPTSASSLPVPHPNATPDHDDISFIPLPPSENAPSSVVQIRSYQKPISSEENVPTSSLSATAPQRLYIAPSTLTASQKEEYRIVSLSTQGTQDNLATQDDLAPQENIPPESSLPAVPPSDPYPHQMFGDGLLYAGAGTAYKSSGMTTVVPSNLSDFIRRGNGDGALDAAAAAAMTLTSGLGSGSLEMGTPARVRTTFSASSPDIIGGASPGTRRSGRKRKASQFSEQDATENSPLVRSQLAEVREMSAEENADFAPGATDTPQASEVLGNDQLQNEQITEQHTDATVPSSTVRKKRGRKKKEPIQMVTEEDAVLDNSFEASEYQQQEEVPVAAPEPTELGQPPPKRRRGRPRKSDVAATQKSTKQPTPAPEHDEGDELASPAPTTGRKRGAVSNTNTRKRKASAPIVINDSESDGDLSDPPEELLEADKEAENDPVEAEPEIPPSDEDENGDEEEELPRKRGRPVATATAAVAPTKGKRGRPPKNKVLQEVSASSARKNSRSKSKRQAESDSDDQYQDQDQDLKKDPEEQEEAGAVTEKGSNKDDRGETTPIPDAKPPRSPETPAKEVDEVKDKDVKKEKEIIKPTSFLSTQGKVKYRVGLSKRSRVASLLKVVPRKQ
ncbi:hypothetical protein GE21DRAFT_3379 [Neurospora crassa]|uniref:AT hook domain-containing protein n=2 Tax=Neurospora crassa TaxID=5141 RepID=Q1K556_NEUCR|nr:hypothetical protein NCU01623 [Neurospora crassa OR74A]EAA27298.1 hypothetical protein NCU01623 [Neurospora crassa OR74A]KHE87108.1 hypothetical protein GE21DRAFT_3379 [Neurospora crassa]CAB91363.1 related to neurofilament-H protein [Neurospora crassa]|eukprot:XP_956534.1 hypothetical protein NCU01623 [Neurospora crassa OR74A]